MIVKKEGVGGGGMLHVWQKGLQHWQGMVKGKRKTVQVATSSVWTWASSNVMLQDWRRESTGV
jgi:hypothetical protein